MRERIVYRHPKGRFEVIERSGKDIFGNLYRIREARLTPEKDERGLLTNAALPVPVLRDRPAEPQRDKPKTTRGGWRKKLTDEEKTWIRRLFENGMSMKQIARKISRSDTVVRDYLTDEAKLRTPRGRRAWTDEEREEARRLYASGMTLHQVGEVMGRTFSAVKHAMEKKTG